MVVTNARLKYQPCKDCYDPEHNPGYHIRGPEGIPERVHFELDPSQFKQPLMLDIGAGGISSDSRFTSVDLFTDSDIKATMWDIPLPDNSVEGIFSSNALEHVGQKQVVPTLKEWHRLLKPQGKLQLIVPDLEWAVAWWLEHQDDLGWPMAIIFGHQKHEGEYHKTGFTPKILQTYFERTERPWFINKIEYLWGNMEQVTNKEGKLVWDVTQRCINVEASKLE